MKVYTVQHTVGKTGTGKSFMRFSVFAIWWLRNRQGVLYHNYPVFDEHLDNIQKYVDTSLKFKDNRKHVRDYIKRIPQEWIDKATYSLHSNQTTCIFQYFVTENIDITGCHIAIDEAHNFIPKGCSRDLIHQYQNWCGEVRHLKASVEFITQNVKKMNDVIKLESNAMLVTELKEDSKIPWLGIRYFYWYNVLAVFSNKDRQKRKYPVVFILRQKVQDNDTNRWKTDDIWEKKANNTYFSFYDSFSKPVAIDAEHSNSKKTENDKPYMKYDRVGILFWFLFNNFQRTLIYGGIFLLMVTSPLWVFSVCPALITGIQTYTSKIFSPKIKENKTDATLPDQETSKVSNPLPIKKTKKVKVHLHRAQDYEDTPDNGHPEYVKHEEYAKLLIDYETKIELLEKLQADNEKLKEELSYKQDDIKSIITHIDPNAIYIGIDRFELGKRFRHMKKIYTINEINFEYKFVIVQATGEEEKKILL